MRYQSKFMVFVMIRDRFKENVSYMQLLNR
jgi:hypothetical protein